MLPIEDDSQENKQDQEGKVSTEPSTQGPLTALAKANILIEIYFRD